MADVQLTASLDPSGVSAGTAKMSSEVKAFVGSAQKEFRKLDLAAKKAFEVTTRSSRQITKTSQGKSGGGGSFAAGNIAMQAQDVAVQLQAGARLSTVIAQQGSQALSAFGPRGAVYGGILAIGVALADVISGAKEAEKAIQDLEKATQMQETSTRFLTGGADSANKDARIQEERNINGDIAADRLAMEVAHQDKIRKIRQEAGQKNTNFEKAERRRFAAEMAGFEENVIRDGISKERRQRENPKIKFEVGAKGDRQQFEAEKQLEDIRLTAEKQILELREQGLDTAEAIAQVEVETARKIAEARGKQEDKLSVKSAEQKLKSATRQAFVEAVSWEKEESLLNMRGSEDQKRWKVLKAEEAFLKRISGNSRDPRTVQEAMFGLKVGPSKDEQTKINQQLALNAAGQSNFFHDRTFGKSQSDIRKQLKEEQKLQREEEKHRKRQSERGGLIDVERDMNGKVIGGRDPITGERLRGDDAQRRMKELRDLINNPKPGAGGKLADATVQDIVTAFAAEIRKLIAT